MVVVLSAVLINMTRVVLLRDVRVWQRFFVSPQVVEFYFIFNEITKPSSAFHRMFEPCRNKAEEEFSWWDGQYFLIYFFSFWSISSNFSFLFLNI